MDRGSVRAAYDHELRVEAYHFKGAVRPFPEHFHEYYVVGVVEAGERRLICNRKEYAVIPGDMLLFNPGDNHACTQCGGTLDYRSVHFSKDTLMRLTGGGELDGLLCFKRPVVSDRALTDRFRAVHRAMIQSSAVPAGEIRELLSELLEQCGQARSGVREGEDVVEKICAYLEKKYESHISLEQMCRFGGISKSTLLRAFLQEKGITPYRYLENVRISAAKRLLEQGVPPAEAAAQTGFSDQSHFTNYFTRFIGISPGAYQMIFRKEDKG